MQGSLNEKTKASDSFRVPLDFCSVYSDLAEECSSESPPLIACHRRMSYELMP